MSIVPIPNQKPKRQKFPKTTEEMKMQIALGTLETASILSLLRSKKTSSDIIEMLNNVKCNEDWDDSYRRIFISKHPNTPTPVLESIFYQRKFMENPGDIRPCDMYIVIHPAFPVKLLREIAHKLILTNSSANHLDHYLALHEAIKNPNIPVECLCKLAKHKNPIVRVYVAQHLNTPPEVLKYLSSDPQKSWGCPRSPKEYVASNPHTPPDVLTTMSILSNINVRKRVALNPSTPINTLKTMITVKDKSQKVRHAALYTLFELGEVVFK